MSRETSELAQKIAELRARFPEADVELIEDALAHSSFDTATASGMLIGFGCKLASLVPSSMQAPSAVLQPPIAHHHVVRPVPSGARVGPQITSAHPHRSSVFDDFKPDFVEKALDKAQGAEEAALEVDFQSPPLS